MYVYPSILEKNKKLVFEKMSRVKGLVDEVQIDICDGVFVPSKTAFYTGNKQDFVELREMLDRNEIEDFELDLMIDLSTKAKRTKWVSIIKEFRPRCTVFHLGSTTEWSEIVIGLMEGKKLATTMGLSVHSHHTIKEISKMLDTHPFSYIQVMGIDKVGFSGQKLSKKSLALIKALHKKHPEMHILVDGGVSLETAKILREAGAHAVCPNSALFKSDNIKETIKKIANA